MHYFGASALDTEKNGRTTIHTRPAQIKQGAGIHWLVYTKITKEEDDLKDQIVWLSTLKIQSEAALGAAPRTILTGNINKNRNA